MRRLLALTLLLVCAAPALAQDPGLRLEPLDGAKGWIGVRVVGEPGATVTVGEAGVALATVALDASGAAELGRLAAWDCDRRDRALEATDDSGRTAALAVTTPSCRDRYSVRLRPGRPRAGRPVALRIADTWGHGDVRPRVCVRDPAGSRCRRADWEGSARTVLRHTSPRAGLLKVTVDGRTRARARIRPRRGTLRVLAAGDSMIQYVDTALADRLRGGRVRVRSDDHISTGISKPGMFDWVAHARRMARSYKPTATVVFLGANDGFPIEGEDCCGDGWVEGYARRVARMMRSYARGGTGAVYWLTLPVPNRSEFKPIYRAVNRAIVLAAKETKGLARVIDTEEFFTPGGSYRCCVRWQGSTRTVRQSDGVHLNQTGARIAASLVIRAMRRDGVLG